MLLALTFLPSLKLKSRVLSEECIESKHWSYSDLAFGLLTSLERLISLFYSTINHLQISHVLCFEVHQYCAFLSFTKHASRLICAAFPKRKIFSSEARQPIFCITVQRESRFGWRWWCWAPRRARYEPRNYPVKIKKHNSNPLARFFIE